MQRNQNLYTCPPTECHEFQRALIWDLLLFKSSILVKTINVLSGDAEVEQTITLPIQLNPEGTKDLLC